LLCIRLREGEDGRTKTQRRIADILLDKAKTGDPSRTRISDKVVLF
jgi:hypothetical protein